MAVEVISISLHDLSRVGDSNYLLHQGTWTSLQVQNQHPLQHFVGYRTSYISTFHRVCPEQHSKLLSWSY